MRHVFITIFAFIASATASGCAQSTCPGPAPVAMPVVPFDSSSASGTPPVARTPTGASHPWARRSASPCFARGRPRPPAPAKNADAPFCAALDAQEVSAVETRIKKDFVVHDKPSKLVIDFGCDEAYGPSRELVYESGSGHGGSLVLVHFRWEKDGHIAVRRIASSHYHGRGLVIEEAETTASVLDRIVAKSRVALLARPHLVRLYVKSAGLGLSGTFSSNDFHLLVRLTDDAGRATEAQFTGYDSSGEQERILPLRLATEPLHKLVTSLSFRKIDAGEDDRAFFTARFTTTLAQESYWWVKERYVELAALLGTPDAIPALVAVAQRKGDASSERAREAAIESIARISGWNPRVDAAGRKRTTDEAVQAVVQECSP